MNMKTTLNPKLVTKKTILAYARDMGLSAWCPTSETIQVSRGTIGLGCACATFDRERFVLETDDCLADLDAYARTCN